MLKHGFSGLIFVCIVSKKWLRTDLFKNKTALSHPLDLFHKSKIYSHLLF
ncbi:hypothetical protein L289_3677 [Acinetobacter gerneri DSM 14967 = CIP 107464 = MTCC 9824]|nr:hypothetical protein L289_3677 [Acinetobacter gerneri DSM 14967 = CIP 107464 = MTCC 9824]